MTRRHRSIRRAAGKPGNNTLRLVMNRFLPGRGGFSLGEILVVMVILGIGIIPLAMVQHRARREVSKADRFTQAITVAQRQLEEMKGAGFGNAAPDSGAVGAIEWATNVQNVAFGLNRLEVTVNWAEEGQDRTLTVAGMISTR